jgi:AcrR family transcriptional regulator
MTRRKPDRRVQRTRRQLRDALMALITEKGYDAVTIEEITERADLGRTTFYLHYKDKEDLLVQSLEAVYDDLVVRIQQRSLDEWLAEGQGPWTLAFRHAAENARFYQIIISGQGGGALKKRVQDYIAETVQEIITTRMAALGASSSVPVDVVSNYIGSALLGLIAWWLEEERPYTVAEMGAYFRQLLMQGIALISPPPNGRLTQ